MLRGVRIAAARPPPGRFVSLQRENAGVRGRDAPGGRAMETDGNGWNSPPPPRRMSSLSGVPIGQPSSATNVEEARWVGHLYADISSMKVNR
jgi:hypothetical protein